ncbi:MAG: hypothetical protein LBD55_07510 [Treponema sp.]|jgi:hypothetical protein|nr:hypothetical protein [Treponema sp.]
MKILYAPIAAAFIAAVLIAAGCDTGGGGSVPPVTGVTVSPDDATVVKGRTRQFSAEVKGGHKQTVTWTVTGGTAGTSISSEGLLSVAANETAAALKVTAASTEDPTKSGIATVAVTVSTITGVTVSPDDATVVKGGTRQFSAEVKGDHEPEQTVTWTVTGGTAKTSISSEGLLFVAANETAAALKVTAASVAAPAKSGVAAVAVTGNEFSIETEAQWNRAVDAIANGGNNREYTISITGGFSIRGADLSAGTFGAVKGLRVFLRGSETITQSAGGGPLLVIRENQNLILQGLALKGSSQNYYFAVHIAGGSFTMEEGKISGNSRGGGVYIDNGNFIMEGGEISDNSGGSGVFAFSGGFTMKNGKIFGNTASFGGGVNVGNGNFIMEGGEISGNTSKEAGGGVDIYGGGFTMKGGRISDNTSKEGGGVCVFSGSFIMEGGEISGNTSKEAAGGGVFVETRGALIKTGGVITGWGGGQTAGNKVVDKDRNPIPGSGHAVYASGSPAKYLDNTVRADKNLSSSDAIWTE